MQNPLSLGHALLSQLIADCTFSLIRGHKLITSSLRGGGGGKPKDDTLMTDDGRGGRVSPEAQPENKLSTTQLKLVLSSEIIYVTWKKEEEDKNNPNNSLRLKFCVELGWSKNPYRHEWNFELSFLNKPPLLSYH
jgi:hypothetical protein